MNEVILRLLQMLDIPSSYGPVFALLGDWTRFDPLPPKSPIVAHIPNFARFHLKIILLPYEDVQLFNDNFLILLYNQVTQTILNQYWYVDGDTQWELAALECGVEYGRFDEQRYKHGFFSRTIAQYVDKSLLQTVPEDRIELKIIQSWKKMGHLIDPRSKMQTIRQYLVYCQENV